MAQMPKGVSTDTNDKRNDEMKVETMESGYIQMTVLGSNQPMIVYATFNLKDLPIYLHEQPQSLDPPIDIIYIQTCKIIEDKTNKTCIIFEDIVTNIKYKFEQIPDNNNNYLQYQSNNFFNKAHKFIQDCIIDLIWNDITARQQFNKFIKYQRQMANEKSKYLPKLVNAMKKSLNHDKALNDSTTWLQRQKLDEEDRQILKDALIVRNTFWNLLIDTRQFFVEDYKSSLTITAALGRWQKILNKKDCDKLTEKDKKILIWGLTELEKFRNKRNNVENIQSKWQELSVKITEMKVNILKLQEKWQDKLDAAKQFSRICNWIFGAAAVIGIIGGCVAIGIGSIPLGIASGVAIGAGAIFMGVGYLNKNNINNIKDTIDNIQDTTKSFAKTASDWIESISLLDIPLGIIGLNGISTCKDEINGWETMADAEIKYLNSAKDTFDIFSQRCKEALDEIKDIQQKVKC